MTLWYDMIQVYKDNSRVHILWCVCSCILPTILLACTGHVAIAKKQEVIVVRDIDLRSVYRRLDKGGFQPGPYNVEDFTALTQAIRRFQRLAGLQEDGILGPRTWEKMQGLYDPGEPVPSTPGPAREEKPTSSRPPSRISWPPSVITVLQQILTELGYTLSGTNGVLDESTQRAIGQFQQAHGLSGSGVMTRQTLMAIMEKRCPSGCELALSIPPTAKEGAHLAARSGTGHTILLLGPAWEPLFIQGMQNLLTEQGYDTHGIDGVVGPGTQDAIRQFQQAESLPVDGDFTGETVWTLVLKTCRSGCEFRIIVRPSHKPIPTHATSRVPQDAIRTIEEGRAALDYPIHRNDAAYAVEKIECSDISGAWIIFYQGTVLEKEPETISLRLAERFGYRYYPKSEGIDRNDWWCIPRKRHCYSPVDFSDWGGTLARGQETSFPITDVYSAQIGIVQGISTLLQQRCGR